MKPAFIPLKREYFNAFKDGTKQWEYRKLGRQWVAKNFPSGRPVVLSLGYGKKHRLNGVVGSVIVDPCAQNLPGFRECYGPDATHALCIQIKLQDK